MRTNDIYQKLYNVIAAEPDIATTIGAVKAILATLEWEYSVQIYNASSESIVNQLFSKTNDAN